MCGFSGNFWTKDQTSLSYFSQLMKWGGGSRSWFSNEAMATDSNSGLIDVPLAQTGEGIAECELLKWFVKEVSLVSPLKVSFFQLFCFVSL